MDRDALRRVRTTALSLTIRRKPSTVPTPNRATMSLSDRLMQCEQAMQSLSAASENGDAGICDNEDVGGGPGDANAIIRLRREHGDELAQLLITSARLQPKARLKLGRGLWWVTEKSLQQATPWQVAKLKASWLGDSTVYDLCCGIGGDSIRLAARGSVVGIDADQSVAVMAQANLRLAAATLSVSGELDTPHRTSVVCGDVVGAEIPSDAAIHVDPDRRAAGRRTSDPDHYQPPWSWVTEILGRAPAAIVKLAPAAAPQVESPGDFARVWISLAGSVREQSLLHGNAIERADLSGGHRAAYRITGDGRSSRIVVPESEVDQSSTQTSKSSSQQSGAKHPLGECLIDPDAAVRASGLTIAFANQSGLRLLGKPSGFLSGDIAAGQAVSDSGLGIVGRVVWQGSADDRKLRREFRSRDVYPETIKVRGTGHDPHVLTRRYRSSGQHPVTLWIGRGRDRVFAAITEPMLPAD